VTHTPAARSLHVRHVQLARAAIAAIAAIIVTFSPDHSAAVGLSIFSGFALATAVALLAAGWLVHSAETRRPSVVIGALTAIAGLIAAIPPLQSVTTFFVVLVAWALATGVAEAFAGARGLRAARGRPRTDAARTESRDGLTVGILTIALGLGLLLVPTQYALRYTIDEANATFTLTGIIIGVGIFGAYAAILAVYLAIAGFSPRSTSAAEPATGTAVAVPTDARTAANADTDADTDVTAETRSVTATDERGIR
jgi:MFS family permease